ncbi:hypothetical protein WA556_001617 [Blastocystis sp. ATCC 50177/Nand II]
MKYLEVPPLSSLCAKINQNTESGIRLNCRIEVYSCKMSAVQKKLSRKLREDYLKDSDDAFVTMTDSSREKMDDPEVCKVYGYLISTLNASYSDYDFSSLRPDQFRSIQSVDSAMSDINRHLCEIPEVSQNNVLASLWKEIDKAITLRDTLVYTYISDLSEDPLSEGNMWSFNYFFYNKESKKMLFIACSSKSTFHPSESFSTFPVLSQEATD